MAYYVAAWLAGFRDDEYKFDTFEEAMKVRQEMEHRLMEEGHGHGFWIVDGDEEDGKEERHMYGMMSRGFSIGCQPMDGFKERIDDENGEYYDLLFYDRMLVDEELNDYDLVYLGKVYR